MLKILDKYILKRFIGTFFFSISLMLCIFIVFDISEKLQDFVASKIPLKEIIFDHYLNFIPFYGNLFSPLFTFISVIFFTSKMAYKTEFVAILSSGTSFRRILRPYMIGATLITVMSLILNHFIIPRSNKVRIAFEDKYINNGYNTEERNIHKQIAPGTILYLADYDNFSNSAHYISIEKIANNKQISILKADNMKWDSLEGVWNLTNVFERELIYVPLDSAKPGMPKQVFKEIHRSFPSKKIRIDFTPKDMLRLQSRFEVLPYFELKDFIIKEKIKGSSRIAFFEVEMYKRTAFPFATFILTIIGVSISSRKIRGGVGLHIALGLVLSCVYILFMHISTTFATSDMGPPLLMVWIPNIIFSFVAFYLYKNAQQ
ncbi:MAG: LptF/LptG family permease [Bacteroidetes bacterium]|nr:LptF/LptG family permease [Bacteroidota bacterium]